MVPRRFVNLVMKNFGVGGSYWLSRVALEDNLLYSSTAEAAAAQAQSRREKRTAVVSQPFGATLELPPPVFRFKSSRTACLTIDFMPFYGPGGGGGEGKIVAVELTGHNALYDADAGCVEMLPRLNVRQWRSPISLRVTDGGGADALYAINSYYSSDFEALVYRDDPSCHGARDADMAWRWLRLPPPPYVDDPSVQDRSIQSYALLGDGKTICFSSVRRVGDCFGFGTYCFDTSTHVWTRAGRWRLPFVGRAVHVPELRGLCFGILEEHPHSLCAVDLSSSLGGTAAPKVLHRWRDLHAGDDWHLFGSSLLYLGAGRFCFAKFFNIYDGAGDTCVWPDGLGAVLAGVEVVDDGQADKPTLRMIRHKTTSYIFHGCSLKSVL